MIAYAKLAGILAVVVGLFGLGFHFGGMGPTAALGRLQAAQSADVAKAVLAERASAAAELARVNGILRGYENAPIDPIVPGIAVRVLRAACPSVSQMPSAGPNASGIDAPSGIPGSDPEIERLSQDAYTAGAKDAARLELCKAAWPR